ncbi:MAG: glycosyltransferase family 2 protein [Actinomycetaceae bacterium]|nr:glycosyltransferase family 2 protein [Actinomycetaceae bacterium]
MSDQQKELISIIVPVYNTQRYLQQCVDSIMSQTFENWELILVDDGSTDGISGRLCDEISHTDRRIRVIHQENKGLSGARNTGLEAAEGEFVVFVDSDDYVLPEYLATLQRTIDDADLAVVGIIDKYSDKDEINFRQTCVDVSYQDFFKLTLLGEVPGSVCNRMYRRSALKDLRFREGKYYEDSFFTADGVGHLESVAINTVPLYVYYHRENSITTEPYAPRALHLIEAAEYSKLQALNLHREVQKAAEFRCISSRFVVLDRIILSDMIQPPAEQKEIIKYLRSHTLTTLSSKNFHITRKIAALALLASLRLYSKLVKMKAGRRTLG